MKRVTLTVTAVVEADDRSAALERLGLVLIRAADYQRRTGHRYLAPLESCQPVRQLDIAIVDES